MNILDKLYKKYKLTTEEQNLFFKIIKDIYNHTEFQKRLKEPYFHHGKVTLGEHILETSIKTFILSNKTKNKKNFNLEYALKIAIMHDLYTYPWQNSKIKKKSIFHKHGFSHPLEAIINSINWFPNEFIDIDKSKVLIDGIIHHMYPMPVTSFKSINDNCLELINFDLIKNISKENIDIIVKSSNRRKSGKVSIARSKYKEGRVVEVADKLTTLKQLKSIKDFTALITGNNTSLN